MLRGVFLAGGSVHQKLVRLSAAGLLHGMTEMIRACQSCTTTAISRVANLSSTSTHRFSFLNQDPPRSARHGYTKTGSKGWVTDHRRGVEHEHQPSSCLVPPLRVGQEPSHQFVQIPDSQKRSFVQKEKYIDHPGSRVVRS